MEFRIVFKTVANKEFKTTWIPMDNRTVNDMLGEMNFYNNKGEDFKLFTDWHIEYKRA